MEIIGYIAQSIDIIINMKNEELESGPSEEPLASGEPLPSVTSLGSVESQNLIMQSMKEALKAMNEKALRQKNSSTGQLERQL